MITLLGGNGYVGSAIRRLLLARKLPHVSLSRAEVDYTDTAILTRWLETHKPEFLINAAGYTGRPNVDACEKDKTNCLFGNAILPGRLAEACRKTGTPWGHVSSGCIYTGSRPDGSGFREIDTPNFSFRTNNCSFYSGTKALGEEILAGEPNLYIWRMRIPFNHEDGPRNYLSKVMRYARLLEATNSITQLDEFAAVTIDSWLKKIPFGLYNVTNPGAITTRQVAGMIRDHGLAPHDFEFFENEADFMRKAAITPRSNCTLDACKLSAAGLGMKPVEEALRLALTTWIPEKRS
jgi:UDP-glucose 4,6-dehydratase/3,5-epimerase/4-reductase